MAEVAGIVCERGRDALDVPDLHPKDPFPRRAYLQARADQSDEDLSGGRVVASCEARAEAGADGRLHCRPGVGRQRDGAQVDTGRRGDGQGEIGRSDVGLGLIREGETPTPLCVGRLGQHTEPRQRGRGIHIRPSEQTGACARILCPIL